MKARIIHFVASASVILAATCSNIYAQKNKSPRNNYKQLTTSSSIGYLSKFDQGYVKILDGTVINGEIQIRGDSFDKISSVNVRSDVGEKYIFHTGSLLEFGLKRSTVNATPNSFVWDETGKKGIVHFGFVKTNSGQEYEGEITITKNKGRLEKIEIENRDKEKQKFEAEDVAIFGAKEYVDPKCAAGWPLINFNKSYWGVQKGTSEIDQTSYVSSESFPGYVIDNQGQKSEGSLTVYLVNDIVNKVHVEQENEKKKLKLKYDEFKEYGAQINTEEYMKRVVKKWEISQIHPEMRLYPGAISFEDGTIKKGLIAKKKLSDESDIIYASEANALVELYTANQYEEVVQNIPEEDRVAYKKYVYERDHVLGYEIQRPTRWEFVYDYGTGGSKTRFQPGYVKTKGGEIKIGAISRKYMGANMSVFLIEAGKEEVKFKREELAEYGLLNRESSSVFPASSFDKKQKGFIQLLGSNEMITGILTIDVDVKAVKTDGAPKGNVTETTFIMDVNGEKIKYEGGLVDVYGLIDLSMEQLFGNQLNSFDDPRRNFHPGSFVLNGAKKEGFIAYTKNIEAGDEDVFFFSESEDGLVNVYYKSKGAEDVTQLIAGPNIDETAGSEEENSIPLSGPYPGHVVTWSGDQQEGDIKVEQAAKGGWFFRRVNLTNNGETKEYGNDKELKSISFEKDGNRVEYVFYQFEYVEVLNRVGPWIQIRNPHPTTPSFANDLLNGLAKQGMNAARDEMDKEIAKEAGKRIGAGKASESEMQFYASYFTREKVDYTKSNDFFTLNAKEHIVLNENDQRHFMYIPGMYYNQIEAQLMGCYDFLLLDKDTRKNLVRMKDPVRTLAFLNKAYGKGME
ncbi:MAG TPA: hypothetical protein DCX54_04510 [Flavobacteriales bacterium]|nr:hypothetical protein [Flavobacteriales bacterium]